eukprot:gnl/Trimastix_PCT/461.p1 GENE.gnl/Trimastix_PCT/461~~gnl/Trimastix_PCT/461.p1  ORF type:complete len:322 (+),score=27.44 gnl/Trimastix_PCT/461:105-968(+)
MQQSTVQFSISRGLFCAPCTLTAKEDTIAVEQPLALTINTEPYTSLMRMPNPEGSDDVSLVTGYLFAERIIVNAFEILEIDFDENHVRVSVTLDEDASARFLAQRSRLSCVTASACRTRALQFSEVPLTERDPFPLSLIGACQHQFSQHQRVFDATGCTHCVAVFNRQGGMLAIFEDVGRHNALDKCAGQCLIRQKQALMQQEQEHGEAKHDQIPCEEIPYLVFLSSRVSHEMVHKAFALRAQVIVGISAATSMAVELAAEKAITLIGFCRGKTCNVYTFPERVQCE